MWTESDGISNDLFSFDQAGNGSHVNLLLEMGCSHNVLVATEEESSVDLYLY